MERHDIPIRQIVLTGTAVALAVPPLVFVSVALGSGLGLPEVLSATAAQYSTRRLNLLVMGALGIVPFGLLGLLLAIYRRFVADAVILPLAVAGGTVITMTLLWAHATYWPLFLPDRVAPMFPHGLELVMAPLVFAPVLSLAGVVMGLIVQRVTGPR